MPKVYEITPSPDGQFDSLLVLAGDTWESGVDAVESALESQFHDKPWAEISVTIRCREMSDDELNELCHDEDN